MISSLQTKLFGIRSKDSNFNFLNNYSTIPSSASANLWGVFNNNNVVASRMCNFSEFFWTNLFL